MWKILLLMPPANVYRKMITLVWIKAVLTYFRCIEDIYQTAIIYIMLPKDREKKTCHPLHTCILIFLFLSLADIFNLSYLTCQNCRTDVSIFVCNKQDM